MARIVQKFGGTSVADIARLEMVSLKIRREVDAGHQVAVVVSAMAGVTNQLLGYAHALAGNDHTAEYDVVAAAGEQITSGLLALALNQIGIKAQSLLAWQIPVLTDDSHGSATIETINPDILEACLANRIVPVIAGFQGLSRQGRLTTLGRGGSDTTAVALAAALKADRCDIYTDVRGVFTADPRIVPEAQLLKAITYEEMFELAAHGAKVLQKKSVETAWDSKVKVRILSSFHEEAGTEILNACGQDKPEHEPSTWLKGLTGIAHSGEEAQLTLKNVRHPSQALKEIFEVFRAENIYIDMVVQTVSLNSQTVNDIAANDSADMSFTVLKREIPRAMAMLQKKDRLFYDDLILDPNIAKVTVVGKNLHNQPELATLIFNTLAGLGISHQVTAYAPIKVSIVVNEMQAENSIRALHAAFGMDREL